MRRQSDPDRAAPRDRLRRCARSLLEKARVLSDKGLWETGPNRLIRARRVAGSLPLSRSLATLGNAGSLCPRVSAFPVRHGWTLPTTEDLLLRPPGSGPSARRKSEVATRHPILRIELATGQYHVDRAHEWLGQLYVARASRRPVAIEVRSTESECHCFGTSLFRRPRNSPFALSPERRAVNDGRYHVGIGGKISGLACGIPAGNSAFISEDRRRSG